MVSKERAMKLKITEFDEEFSEDYADGSQVGWDHMYSLLNRAQ